jgi:hypothetical protein
MPRPPIDLGRKLKDILKHVQDLPVEASSPLAHSKRTGTDIWNTLQYVELPSTRLTCTRGRPRRHLGRINAMVLVNLIEAFERFLKELASACVDHLANFVLDDRFNAFSIQGSGLASHFGTATLGRSLCESGTWLDCEEINRRFRRLLADPFQEGGASFNLFPKQESTFTVLGLVWQLRHTVVHNVGIITQSDAVKLRLWAREPVASPRVLSPTREDIRYLKRFLDETAQDSNDMVGDRLAVLLTTLHAADPTLFVAQQKADEVTRTFGSPRTIAGTIGVLPAL